MNDTQSDDFLKERVILITGAGDGIGKAVALACARQGATVILSGKTISKLETVYDAIINKNCPPPAIYPINFEGATTEHYRELHNNIEKEFGKLDGLLNNSGWLGTPSPIEHYDAKLWFKVIQINLNAPFLLTKCCLPLLAKASSASILFTVDNQEDAYWGAYGVAKSGITTFMKILAHELEDKNICVSAIDPGAVRTKHRAMAFPGEDMDDLKTADSVADNFVRLLGETDITKNGTIYNL